ncbi:hypothetical protein C8R46DRAFT_1040517 [Mycena filopes]|nr:hypothetical protein C8R46DRAFT_1040517 [Mycena filopes]
MSRRIEPADQDEGNSGGTKAQVVRWVVDQRDGKTGTEWHRAAVISSRLNCESSSIQSPRQSVRESNEELLSTLTCRPAICGEIYPKGPPEAWPEAVLSASVCWQFESDVFNAGSIPRCLDLSEPIGASCRTLRIVAAFDSNVFNESLPSFDEACSPEALFDGPALQALLPIQPDLSTFAAGDHSILRDSAAPNLFLERDGSAAPAIRGWYIDSNLWTPRHAVAHPSQPPVSPKPRLPTTLRARPPRHLRVEILLPPRARVQFLTPLTSVPHHTPPSSDLVRKIFSDCDLVGDELASRRCCRMTLFKHSTSTPLFQLTHPGGQIQRKGKQRQQQKLRKARAPAPRPARLLGSLIGRNPPRLDPRHLVRHLAYTGSTHPVVLWTKNDAPPNQILLPKTGRHLRLIDHKEVLEAYNIHPLMALEQYSPPKKNQTTSPWTAFDWNRLQGSPTIRHPLRLRRRDVTTLLKAAQYGVAE